ncbi:MAG: hypothetical protein LBI58_05715 [Tannerellaceae bacterium]|jgi:hypothetical protein|nr:hypothetical protein [Tannerellaceae bacterium]
MKNIILLIAGIFFLTACPPGDKKGGVDIKYEMKVSVDVLDVVKDLRDLDNAELFPDGVIDDGSHVRVKLFIFDDSDDSLFSEDTQIIDDFSQKATVTKSMASGRYTIVATADMVENDGDKITFQCWDFKNTASLRNFRIIDLGYKGYSYKAMGVSQVTVDVNRSLSTDIKVEPVGALVTFFFQNLNISEVAYLYYAWDKVADYYLVGDGTSNSIDNDVENEYEVSKDYTGVYDQRYFLPVRDVSLTWGTFDKDIKVVKSNTLKFNVEKGKNITIGVDTKSGTANVSQTTRASSTSLSGIQGNRKKLTGKKDR